MTSGDFFSKAKDMTFDNSSFSNIGQDQINNDYRVYNNRSEQNYGGSGNFINHGRDQNVNTGEGKFVIGESHTTPRQDACDQNTDGLSLPSDPDKEKINPFRRLIQPNTRRTHTDTEFLESIKTILKDKRRLDELLQLRGDRAEKVLEDMQRATYLPECDPLLMNSILNVMIQLSEASGRCAQSYYNPNVRKIGDSPFSTKGTFTDVWKGRTGDRSQIVVLKVVRPEYTSEVAERLKIHMREVLNWRKLDHPNILPFIGHFLFGGNPRELCLVSPWMEKGNLIEYLQNNPADRYKRLSIAIGIASGLTYLHSLNIIHGDLKRNNVFITSQGVACLTDFGLFRIFKYEAGSGDARPTPWCAPEILAEGSVSEKGDVYAYGSVCYGIFAERFPFADLSEDALNTVIKEQEQNPENPPEIEVPMLWEVIKRCWSPDPALRPAASDVIPSLEAMASVFSQHHQSVDDPLFFLAIFLAFFFFFVVR